MGRCGITWLIALLALTGYCHSEPSADHHLGSKISSVIFKEIPIGVGDTVAKRIVSGVEQIAAAYQRQHKEPLPVIYEASAVHWIAHSTVDPNTIITPRVTDLPLPEALRGWLSICELDYRVESGRIVISKSANKK